jgi:hypothetical protein
MRTEKNRRRVYARLSKIAYEGKNEDLVRNQLRDLGLGRVMTYLPKLSTKNYKTFLDKRTGKAIISYRGTDIKNLSDLSADTAIFFGVEPLSQRFNDALLHAKAVEKTVGRGNVELTGHSLGGSEALYVTENTGMPSVTFNPGKTFYQFDLLGNYKQARNFLFPESDKSNKMNAKIYTTKGDAVSFNADRSNGEVTHVPACNYDVHGINNFIGI